jgi:diguanylate cyclase (GGDEF)-like protein/PAS domain S-box-containing protein
MRNSPQSANIIIVDNNPQNLKLLGEMLKGRGHTIRLADSGELALISINAKVPDLILLDVRMPRLDGYEVCRRIKANPKAQNVPVIFLTASDAKEDRAEGYKAGCSDFITKPFQIEEVLNRVDYLLKTYFLEEELRSKAERMENIIAGTNAGTWEWNVQTGEQTINERWAEMLGYSVDELSPISIETWKELCHPEDLIENNRYLEQVFQNKIEYYELEFRMKHKKGNWVWISSKGKVNSWTPEGKVLLVSGIHLDITDSRQKMAELQNVQMLLKSSLESPKDMIILSIDQNYNYYYFNQAHRDVMKYAYGKDVDVGMNLMDCITSEEDKIKAKINYDLALKGTSHTTIQEYGEKAINYYETYYNPIINDDNEIMGATAFARDITDRKRVEEQLTQSEERFQLLFNKAPLGYQSLDYDGCLIDVNHQWLDMLGYTREEVIGKWFGDFLAPAYRDRFIERFPMFKALGKIHSEFELICKNGEERHIAFDGKVGYGLDGDFKQTHCILKDITESKELELQLANEKKLLEATLISVGDGVISCDKNGDIIFINPIAEQLTGWLHEDAKGKPIEEVLNLVHELTGQKCESIAKKVLESGKINELENHTILISKDGTRRPIEDSAAPIIQDNGDIIGVVIVFSDCTDKQKRIQQIEYLSYHDFLTGLYNRRFFEEELKRLDTARNLPLTIIMGDVNGLKLINDSFGHAAGDELLKCAAETITNGCRADDIVARFGGDEFVILLPKTDTIEAEIILKRIQNKVSGQMVGAVTLSISFGFDTKRNKEEDIQVIFRNAEDQLYRHKLSESAGMRSKTIDLIMKTLYEKNNREMRHSKRVSEISESIAKHMGLAHEDSQ